jgi:dihydroorotase-like cyclic amidohydrolase
MSLIHGFMLCCGTLVCAANADCQSLPGVIDIHVHTAPDSVPRSIDAIDLARLAESRGMRAIVFKNHFEPTASTAYLVHKVVPGIQVFGGIDLSLSVGGMNPAAVEKMALTTGGLGKFVWMATYDTYAQVKSAKEQRPYVAVSGDGEVLPETKAVIAMIAKYNLIMATGHNSSEESLMLLREARKQGVTHLVVTHAMLTPIHMSVSQMQEAAKMGAYIEFVYNGVIGKSREFDLADYAKAIREVGVEHCILSSDMGQIGNPLHPDGLELFFTGLRKQGLSQEDIDQMSKVNPARLLGLQ